MEATCPQCRIVFEPRRPNQRFCCARCKWTWTNANRVLRPNVIAECEVCGNPFERYVSPSAVAAGKYTNQYCGLKCKGLALSGANHPMWKGGRCVVNGYVWAYAPDHPHAKHQGYVLEHRLVMEKTIGRLLLPIEVVHHDNENTLDNDPANLLLYASHADHMRDHNANRDRNSLGQYLAKEAC